MNLRDNTAQSRYEMEVGGDLVFARYRREGKVVHLLHVEAAPQLRGTGAAGKFMKALLDEFREQGMKVIPVCGYAAGWLDRHEDYQDLLA